MVIGAVVDASIVLSWTLLVKRRTCYRRYIQTLNILQYHYIFHEPLRRSFPHFTLPIYVSFLSSRHNLLVHCYHQHHSSSYRLTCYQLIVIPKRLMSTSHFLLVASKALLAYSISLPNRMNSHDRRPHYLLHFGCKPTPPWSISFLNPRNLLITLTYRPTYLS